MRSGTVWTQQAYLKASSPDADDNFGISVAVSGDTVVIGVNCEDSSSTGVNENSDDNSGYDSGAAYVFVRSGTSWSQQAYLKASNAEAGDNFGLSVAVSGDTVVIGAPFEDSKATGVNGDQADNSIDDPGAAYVFVRSGTRWSEQAYLEVFNYGTDPNLRDTDGDGLKDGWEVGLGRFSVIAGNFTWAQARADAHTRGGELACFPTGIRNSPTAMPVGGRLPRNG